MAYRSRVLEGVRQVYGSDIAARYQAEWDRATGSASLNRVLRGVVAESYPEASPGWVSRVVSLNRASELPLTNVGWNCKSCGLYSETPSFFDLDHIVPRAVLKGVKRSGRRASAMLEPQVTNLQVLCPNCHRDKTLNLEAWYLACQSEI